MLGQHRPPAARSDREAGDRAPQDSVHLRRGGREADREPMHRSRERRTHDRRDSDQHGAAGDQPRVPDADDGRAAVERRAARPSPTATSTIGSRERRHEWSEEPIEDDTQDGATRACTVTVDEAMALAVDAPEERAVRARPRRLCRAMLKLEPEHPDALHYAGVLAHKRGQQRRKRSRLIERSLELVPDQPDWYSNLGIVLQANGESRGARWRRSAAPSRSIRRTRTRINNLGVLLGCMGRLDEAEAVVSGGHRAQSRSIADVYLNLAVAARRDRSAPGGGDGYCKAMTLKPRIRRPTRHLAMAYCVIGERRRRSRCARNGSGASPDDPRARHTLAAYSRPRRAAARVRRVRAEGVRRVCRAASRPSWRGCSTARRRWCAEALAAAAIAAGQDARRARCRLRHRPVRSAACALRAAAGRRRSVAGGMLKPPREKQVYDELVQAELTAYLGEHARRVRRDRHRRYAGLLRRARRGRRRGRARRCGRAACWSSRSRRRPNPDDRLLDRSAAARPVQRTAPSTSSALLVEAGLRAAHRARASCGSSPAFRSQVWSSAATKPVRGGSATAAGAAAIGEHHA